ncbi:somatostatin receptor type 5-like [Saccoglossus kowalevskii]|uniref:Somatostatin receptor type 2-like n=1 Tax=Saccoglossus kowalevskii TaxID=10224 RepID=A0ABM0GU42_SACKO|nr:PREDICTED: somatostatin receptor type 2-like [Saccoglossus kowalevskii]
MAYNDSSSIIINITDEYLSYRPPEWFFSLFVPLFSGLVCITGIPGNGFVMFMLLRYSGLRTVPNVYIFNLALADLMFLCSLPFLAYLNSTFQWIFGGIMCKLVLGIDGMNMFTGIYILTAMSVDRYLAIVHGIRSMKYRTVKMAKFVNCAMWALSVAVTLPVWIYAQEYEGGCDMSLPDHLGKSWFILYTFVLGFIVPVFIITGCYVFISYHILTTEGPRSENKQKSITGQKKVFVMVALAVAVFIICWLPFYIVRLVYIFGVYNKKVIILFFVSMWMGYANSALNPLIYTYTGGNFRRNFAKMRKRSSGSRRSSFRNSDRHTTIRRGDKIQYTKPNRTKRRKVNHNHDVDYDTTYTTCVYVPNHSREVITELVSVI